MTVPGSPVEAQEGESNDFVLIRPGEHRPGKRFLLVAAAFPPSSAVGALRWEKFVGLLADAGLEFDVVTMHPDETELPDMSRLQTLPPSTRVIGVRARPSVALRLLLLANRARTWITSASVVDAQVRGQADVRKNAPTLIRTERIGRMPRSLLELQRIFRARLDREIEKAWTAAVEQWARSNVRPSQYLAVISSGPPNLGHVAAATISRRSHTPYVMDMRDPWATAVAVPSEIASSLELRYARRMEALCAQRATAVLVNTPLAKKLFDSAHPDRASHCYIIMNGSDDDICGMQSTKSERFVITFAGSIYIDRNPRMVFRAAAAVIREFDLSPREFGFDFIGSVAEYGGTSSRQIAREEGVDEFLQLEPFMPRTQLLTRLQSASMLLSLPQDVETSIPAKIFEYMSFSAWLLILAAPGSATASLLEGSGADVVPPDDLEEITARIRARYREHVSGIIPRPIALSGAFTRARQAALLNRILLDVAAP